MNSKNPVLIGPLVVERIKQLRQCRQTKQQVDNHADRNCTGTISADN